MKSALILHGTNANHTHNWFPWLSEELIKLGYSVWLPDLPGANHPTISHYNSFLLNHQPKDWEYSNDSILIGHSSGAVELLALLSDPDFPKDIKVKACFLVGAFKGDLGWESLKGMAADFDYELIKQKSSKFIFLHSDDDPYCPIADAQDICRQLSGKFIGVTGQGHFTVSLDPQFTKLPDLLKAIKDEEA